MNAKKKGNAGENKVAHWLDSHGFKAFKNGSSGGNMWKGDVHNNLSILGDAVHLEVKTVKRINLLDAWQQADRDAGMAKAIPVLLIHFDGMPENTWLTVLHSEDFIHVVKSIPQNAEKLNTSHNNAVRQSDRELEYATNNVRVAITKLLKLL